MSGVTSPSGAGFKAAKQIYSRADQDYFEPETADRLVTNYSSGIANGMYITVFIPTAGKKFKLYNISIGVSVAGVYTVYDGTTLIMYFRLGVNQNVQFILVPKCYTSVDYNRTLYVYNNSGSTASIAVNAQVSEEG